MATRFEVFDKLRVFGNTLDKASNTLSSLKDDDPEERSKARACLKLRAILAETRSLKEDTKKMFSDTKNCSSFDEFLVVCEKQAEQMKEDLEKLEEYLEKYGYQKQKEKLPEVRPAASEETDEHADSSEQSSLGSPQCNSDKENQLSEAEKFIDIAEKMDEKDQPSCKEECEDLGLLLTPVQPRTFTRLFIHNDECAQKRADTIHTPDLKEPLPPGTTTPMIKPGKSWEVTGVETPDTSSELPAQPATRTPMIKASQHFGESPTFEATPRINKSVMDDFPKAPTFSTPGLQRYGSKRQGGDVLPEEKMNIVTPPAPFFSLINLLDPDDSPTMAATEDLTSNTTNSNAKDGMIKLPDIDRETFLRLPECLQQQFSLELVNHLIGKTNKYLVVKGDSGYVSDEEMMSVLDLGPMTRAFILVMIKLNYLTIVKKGLYEVLF